jgi:hypothetical protein
VLPPDGGDDGVLDGVPGVEPGVVVSDGELLAGGGGVVCGDAEGGRSSGRSPTRSVGDSVQPAASPAVAVITTRALSNLFIPVPPQRELDGAGVVQSGCHARRALIH